MTAGEKNVLYISYDGMTDALGQSQVIPYLTGLSCKGYNFTILSCEKKDKYEQHHSYIKQLLDDAAIKWEPLFYTKKPPVLSTLYDYGRLTKKAVKLHNKYKFVLVHSRSYIAALVALKLKSKHQVPFVFDMRGFWADERVDGGLWQLQNPVYKLIYKYFKNREISFLNQSAAVISLTGSAKGEMMTWPGISFGAEKITVIPCCVDTQLFDPGRLMPQQKSELRKSLGISGGDFVIGYLGSIGTWYMLDEMMMYFANLKHYKKNARFLLVTHDNAGHIRDVAAKYNLSTSDVIITAVGRNEVPAMISLFNFGLFFIKPVYSKMASSPTKQGEIMSMGIPLICNRGVGDTDGIITTYKAGIMVDGTDFKSSLQQLTNKHNFDANEIRNGAIDYFSLSNGVDLYFNVYNSIIN